MTQDYDPATGVSTTPTGAMYDPLLVPPRTGKGYIVIREYKHDIPGKPPWDESWDAWARSAIASGALVPPQGEADEIRHTFVSRLVVVCFLAVAALAIVAPGLIWGFGR